MSATFGTLLKQWRARRGESQLDIAYTLGVSQRHLSAIETGRSMPSREMVLRLGDHLDVPLREQNLLLTAAGHAPAFPETPIDQMGPVTDVLDQLLAAHHPRMAFVLDRHWNLVRANPAAATFMLALFPEPPAFFAEPPLNLARLSLHPDGLRRRMFDWEVSASALLRRLERDAASRPHDEGLHDLLDEVYGYDGMADLPRLPPGATPQDLLLPTTYVVNGQALRLLSTIATIGDPHDLTTSELRIETFWPADEASDLAWRKLVDTP